MRPPTGDDVRSLRETVERLEKRVAALEAELGKAKPPAPRAAAARRAGAARAKKPAGAKPGPRKPPPAAPAKPPIVPPPPADAS
jgi:hypothetical protein